MPVARVLALMAAGGLALVIGAGSARAADPPTVLRPTTAGSYAYTASEATPYIDARAVVHYVTTGPDAPPLADADGSGSPDYVEQVSLAAEKALLYYERHGFKRPLPDTAGPDTKLDIYIKSLPAGVLGLTFTPRFAEGGTFVLIAPQLDTGQVRTLGSLRVAVAHELFHVTQFSYVLSGRIPLWAFEGSATALSMLVFPEVDDLAMKDYLDAWLRTPWVRLYDERFSCVHCYGGAWWWLHLARVNSGILPRYLALLQADERAGRPTRVGVKQLDLALRRSRVGSLYGVFTNFALNLYRRGLAVGNAYSLRASVTPHATSVRTVFGLSTHYVPVHVPPRARGVVVAVPYGDGPKPRVTLVVGGPRGRRVVEKQFRPGKGVIMSTLFRSPAERKRIVLIVTSGRLNGVHYQVGYAAVGRSGRLPGWIAF